jgi:CRISP-associated protein Cas1
MIGRIVEVADDKRHLFLHRGFMVVQDTEGERKELGQVPMDDIAAVIANAHGLSYTNNLLVGLAERGAPFVLCAANHNAVGMLLPIEGNFEQSHRIEAQIAAALPTQKRLWAAVVRAKLEQQAAALEAAGAPTAPLSALVSKVKSGDPGNLEAQGARRYWTLLFGDEFRRDRDAGGVNALLNYAYTVMRATTARAIVAAGLHPSIGLHHSHDNNAMRLVDDMMEPFRPVMDLRVWQLRRNGEHQVTPETKRALVRTLYDDMQTDTGATPVTVCVQRLATSLAQIYLGEREKLDLPLPGLPLALASALQDE